jgi:TELO2-interacting protein 1
MLTPSLISYTFFPLTTVLRRNPSPAIPEQIFEKILIVFGILCESWWWTCELEVWEQIFMLCSTVVGSIEGKGKGKERDDETKTAAVQCLRSLLCGNFITEPMDPQSMSLDAVQRLSELQARARTDKFIPVLGQTIDSLVRTSASQHLPLQRLSLQVLRDLISFYAPDYFVPTILPGVISAMTKASLGFSSSKGWANGEIVAGALDVMQVSIVKAIGDEVCLEAGAIQKIENLDDLAAHVRQPSPIPESQDKRPFVVVRTSVWLRATSSQLHIAINSLSPLVSHSSPLALLALSKFSCTILDATTLTLPQTQPLLLSFALTLSVSSYPTVSHDARDGLLRLLKTSKTLLQTLMQSTRSNLAALPRMLQSQTDSKVEHLAGLIEAVCLLANPAELSVRSTASGIGNLLGPTGGIEKWGWSLLAVLQLETPPSLTRNSAAQLMLEGDPEQSDWVPFPNPNLKKVSSTSTRAALDRMLRSLGRAAGEACLYAVEWFSNIGKSGRGPDSVAALWCACRLLEGLSNLSLDAPSGDLTIPMSRSKRVEKFARGLARTLAELWEGQEADEEQFSNNVIPQRGEEDNLPSTQLIKGIVPIKLALNLRQPQLSEKRPASQLILHKSLCLQILSVTAGILQARFAPLLLHTLYLVLHSLVSHDSYLSSTALAALSYITSSTSYASPANLLLSNFDYALDAVSRRLSRRWLDVDAAKVLAVLVRLVGSDVVQRAGDVVEECFDRLDEYHGYDVIVEGLMEVLEDVIKVVEIDEDALAPEESPENEVRSSNSSHLNTLFDWLQARKNPTGEDTVEYGPAPRKAWGEEKESTADEGNDKMEESEAESQLTPVQALTQDVVSRSIYFLTHGSPLIRARILKMLSSSVPVLKGSSLLPSIHQAWPFILNRLNDSEPFVVAAAASLIENLAIQFGSFMTRRIWDDVWPIFRNMLNKLNAADSTSALTRRGPGVGTESAYTYSHRLYKSLLKTMFAAAKGVQPQDTGVWQVLIAFRRFLHKEAHQELQVEARNLYIAIGKRNEDAVWLALSSTIREVDITVAFLIEPKWDIEKNVSIIMQTLEGEDVSAVTD